MNRSLVGTISAAYEEDCIWSTLSGSGKKNYEPLTMVRKLPRLRPWINFPAKRVPASSLNIFIYASVSSRLNLLNCELIPVERYPPQLSRMRRLVDFSFHICLRSDR